ncbi:MAG: hypothetical protein ACHRXM_33845 [Isosphaerales bacterium]
MGTQKKQTPPVKPVVSPAILEMTRARREQVEYLLQSTDWTRQPELRAFAEMLLDDIADFEDTTQQASDSLTDKIARRTRRILTTGGGNGA